MAKKKQTGVLGFGTLDLGSPFGSSSNSSNDISLGSLFAPAKPTKQRSNNLSKKDLQEAKKNAVKAYNTTKEGYKQAKAKYQQMKQRYKQYKTKKEFKKKGLETYD